MEIQQNLLVGFDLRNNYSQISCYNSNTFEPETIRYDYDSENELLLTAMAYYTEQDEWFLADEAADMLNENKAILVNNIVEAVLHEKNIIVEGHEYSSIDILSSYFRKTLSLIRRYHPNDNIKKLIVTIDRTQITLVKGIFSALEKINIKRNRVSILNHSQAFMYYALNQKKELWTNDVALFDFTEDGMKYYQMTMDRRHRPIMVGAIEKDCTEMLNPQTFEELGNDEKINVFKEIADTMFYRKIITTVYLTGNGFGKWIEKVVKVLGQGRRFFIGQNLFSEGACYAARELAGTPKLEEFVLMSEDMVNSSILISAYHNAKKEDVELVKATSTWYEADNSIEFILSDTSEVEIIVRNDLTKSTKSFIIAMNLCVNRPDRFTRVKVTATFIDVHTCAVTVRDLGFGDFYPATNRVWEKVIKL